MKMRSLVVMALIAVGCGDPPGFNGEWNGTLSQVARCSDGVGRTRDIIMDLRAIEDLDVVRFVGNDACGTISATLNGNVAVLEPKDCGPLQGEGFNYADTIVAGTMELDNDTLDVNVALYTLLIPPSGPTVLCVGPLKGVLHRK